MPSLTWTEIRNRATAFAREWRDTVSEREEAQTLWNEFFQIFGLERGRVAVYEEQVAKLSHAHNLLDRAVDAAYVADGGARKYADDAERVAFLFRRYAVLTSIV
jgi:hypothetical protein